MSLKIKKNILLLLLSVLTACVYSQRFYYHQFEAKGGFGFTVPHRQSLNYLINSHHVLGELSYSIKSDGSETWQHEWRFPEYGISYLVTGLGNINVFGFAQSVYAFYGVPVYETESLLLKYRFGLGAAFLSDKFHHRANHYNNAIGSYTNAHIHFSLGADYRHSEETPLYYCLGLTFNHFSNAAFKKPNLGLNNVSLVGGLKYMMSDFEYSLPRRTLPYFDRSYYFNIHYTIGSRQNTTYENKNYITHSLSGDILRGFNQKRSFGLGFNFVLDPSLKYQLQSNKDFEYKGNLQLFRLGFHLSHEVYLTESLACIMQVGTYAYNSYNDTGSSLMIYNRIGLNYIHESNFLVSFLIRAHTSVADFAELGFGYRFPI